MKMIVGLGNPGKKYEYTKHNIGFQTIDYMMNLLSKEASVSQISKFNALIYEVFWNGEKILLVKPLTYMNLSGEAVRPIMDWYKIDLDEIVVIYDDLDLPLGKIRFREKGSSGGHNGINSIIQHLKTSTFNRVKIGIDHPKEMSVVDYVLTNFTSDEKQMIEESIMIVNKALREWLKGTDFKKIMSTYTLK